MGTDVKQTIAKRVAQELNDGDVVNLGIGLPSLVANFVPADRRVIFQSENGVLGLGGVPGEGAADPDVFDAGATEVSLAPGACFLDSAECFGLIRGGHIQTTVLGAMQVDEKGSLANWAIPGKRVVGFGGAMDLLVGARKVIVAMEHSAKGKPKILSKCTFPLTAVGAVDLIVTEMGVLRVEDDGLVLTEIADGCTVDDIRAVTEAEFRVAGDLKTMQV